MDRPTKVIETSAHNLVIHEWITLEEYRKIMAVLTKTVHAATNAELQAASLVEAQELGVSFVIVELDGSRENILGRLRSGMPLNEAQEIVDIVEEVTNPKKK